MLKVLVLLLSVFFLFFSFRFSLAQDRIVEPAVQRTLYSQPEKFNKLTHFPLVGQQKPNINYMLNEANYGLEKTAKILARYDAIIGGDSAINPDTVTLWQQVFQLNPDLVLTYQHSSWDEDSCDRVFDQVESFKTKMDDLGDFVNKLDAVELDGIGGIADNCGQERVQTVVEVYQNLVQDINSELLLTTNGSIYPQDDNLCQYNLLTDMSGSANFLEQPQLVNGVLEESWMVSAVKKAYYANNSLGYQMAKERMDEVCAWVNNSLQPSMLWAYYEMPTPWWSHANQNNWSKPHSWKNMRVAFTAAQMFNNVVFIYNPTNDSDFDREVNQERAFWGDYYSVVKTNNGRVPDYGIDRIKSSDDNLDLQRENGDYLGLPKSKPRLLSVAGGTFYSREFACGYVYTNLSPNPVSITPSSPTKKVTGLQDINYDNGSSKTSYSVPAGDGLVLLKKECLP